MEFCENGLSTVSVCMWLFKQELVENADVHTIQENGFSPVDFQLGTLYDAT